MGEVYEYGGGDIVGHVDATVRSVANYASYVQGSVSTADAMCDRCREDDNINALCV